MHDIVNDLHVLATLFVNWVPHFVIRGTTIVLSLVGASLMLLASVLIGIVICLISFHVYFVRELL